MKRYLIVDSNDNVYGLYNTLAECYTKISKLSRFKTYHILIEEKLPFGYEYRYMNGRKHSFSA